MPDISLSTLTYDPEGCIELVFAQASDGIHDRTRRVDRVQTTDGGVSVADGGSVHGDRTFVIRARVTTTQRAILQHLYETYSELRCATRDGLFRISPEALTFSGNLATLRLLVKDKEA